MRDAGEEGDAPRAVALQQRDGLLDAVALEDVELVEQRRRRLVLDILAVRIGDIDRNGAIEDAGDACAA